MNSRRFLPYFVLSFLLHCLLFALPFLFKKAAKPEIIEMTILDTSKSKRMVDTKRINNDIDDNANFLSDHNQRVKKEKTAKNTSLDRFIPKFDITKHTQNHEDKNPDEQEQDSKPSSDSLDYIDNLDPDTETALSTKEFVFYTFFSRIRERLTPYWISSLRSKFKSIRREGHHIINTDLPDRSLVTRCLVTLDQKGYLIKVQVVIRSGVHKYDEAAVDAIQRATPFINPPKGMQDSDGNVRLLWDFIFHR